MLGAPLDTLTLLHHAEALVDAPGKRMVTYTIPVRDGDRVRWREVRDHDTSSRGAFPYDQVIPDGQDAFAVIGQLALAAGARVSGRVGDAESRLFQARPLVDFGVGWLHSNFGGQQGRHR
jgi:aminoglycoside 3-N-acetyltransferase